MIGDRTLPWSSHAEYVAMHGTVPATYGFDVFPQSCPVGRRRCTSSGGDCPAFGGHLQDKGVALCSEAEGADPRMQDYRRRGGDL